MHLPRRAFGAFVALAFLVSGSQAIADERGEAIVRQPGARSVAASLDALEAAARAKGFRIFTRIDHAAGAAGVGLELRPSGVLVFGNPKAGTRLMQAAPGIALDLPLRIAVFEDADGRVWISYHAPARLAERYGIPADHPVIANMTAVLAALSDAAAGR